MLKSYETRIWLNGDISCEDMDGVCMLLKSYKAQIRSTLISGYAENGYGEVALKILDEMRYQAFKTNQIRA